MLSRLVPDMSPIKYSGLVIGWSTQCQLGLGSLIQLGHQVAGLPLKGIHLGSRNRLGTGQGHSQRVLVHTVNTELVMQVRTGCKPGCAHVTDDIALPDSGAFVDSTPVAAHMSIENGDIAAVLNDYGTAITALGAAPNNLAV